MQTSYLLRLAAIVAVTAATLSLSSGAAAQENSDFTSSECGAGVIEACGERITYECGWEWDKTFVPFFPYRAYVPRYACEMDIRDLLYRHYGRGTPRDVEQ